MLIKRVFSRDSEKERQDFWTTWNKRDIKITNDSGKTIYELTGVEAPSDWSDESVQICAKLYFKVINGIRETSVKQLFNRVINRLASWIPKYDPENKISKEEYLILFDELRYMLSHQMMMFNSPVFFNFGVPNRPQTSAACYLLGLEDNMDSIREWMVNESKIFQAGSGSGINISVLRPEGAPLSAGGTSSGPLSFMKAADAQAGVIKSGGVTRRAAKIVFCNHDHPDCEKFIDVKWKEEEKAKILIEAGYNGSIDGEAYTTVAHQNANYSVRVNDDFMTQATTNKNSRAHKLLMKISEATWKCGDPGLAFTDTINEFYTLPECGYPTTSNPCGEINNQPDFSACTLASLNLMKFWNPSQKYILFHDFEHAVEMTTIALDIIVGESDYPNELIKKNSINQRHIGPGFCNLGGILMSSGIPYDSDEGRKIGAMVSGLLTGYCMNMSVKLADKLGSFADLTPKNKEAILDIIERRINYASGLKLPEVEALFENVLNGVKKTGIRNANHSAIAPTGTIALIMGADTTGVEPELGIVKYKYLVGGGTIKYVNSTVVEGLKSLNYSSDDIKSILDYIDTNETIVGTILPEHLAVFATSFGDNKGANTLAPASHTKMTAAVQKFITEGVSKTVNLPEEATVEDIYKAYVDAWNLNLKSVSIYRNNSKGSQPLVVKKQKEEPTIIDKPKELVRKKLSDERPALVHKASISGIDFYLTIGLYPDGSPGELFVNCSKEGSTLSSLLDTIGVLFSYSLQYGIPLSALTEKLKGTRSDIFGFTKNPDIPSTSSIIDYIARYLENKFVKSTNVISINGYVNGNNGHMNGIDSNGTAQLVSTHSGELCKNCGGITMQTGTCHTCLNCGDAGGCG